MKKSTLVWITDEEADFYSGAPAILIFEKAFGDEYPEEEEEPVQKENKSTGPSSSPTIDSPLLDERKNSVNDLGESNDNS